ncbi:MAG: hypothetical protein FJ280_23080 [Planctomycetes bacterium]|nr:hypothetical protein [Planctomycetota bacterium]
MVHGSGIVRSSPRYPWPASRIGAADMSLLFRARELSATRTSITELIARAVRLVYGEATGSAPVVVIVTENAEVARAAA